MQIQIFESTAALARTAANNAADVLREIIQRKGRARLIAATGAAQFEFLEILTAMPNIAWDKVELFHLDEYLGIPETHPASFLRFLQERLISKTGIKTVHLLDGMTDASATIRSVTAALRSAPVDMAFIGIGENGHLAFNDPPADFETDESFIVVTLDEPCRQQQFGEGWFPSLSDVPRTAISMTVKQILKAEKILAIVPDKRKAKAVAECFNGEVTPMHPASILRTHPHAVVYLDTQSASLLNQQAIENYKS